MANHLLVDDEASTASRENTHLEVEILWISNIRSPLLSHGPDELHILQQRCNSWSKKALVFSCNCKA